MLAPFQGNWIPLHTLASSGDFYLVNSLLKYNVDINAVDMVRCYILESIDSEAIFFLTNFKHCTKVMVTKFFFFIGFNILFCFSMAYLQFTRRYLGRNMLYLTISCENQQILSYVIMYVLT